MDRRDTMATLFHDTTRSSHYNITMVLMPFLPDLNWIWPPCLEERVKDYNMSFPVASRWCYMITSHYKGSYVGRLLETRQVIGHQDGQVTVCG